MGSTKESLHSCLRKRREGLAGDSGGSPGLTTPRSQLPQWRGNQAGGRGAPALDRGGTTPQAHLKDWRNPDRCFQFWVCESALFFRSHLPSSLLFPLPPPPHPLL